VQSENKVYRTDDFLAQDPGQAMPHKPSPNDPPWKSGVADVLAVLLWLASIAAIVIVPLIFIIPYAISQGREMNDTKSLGEFLQHDPTAIILQIAAIIPAHLLTLALAWVIVTKLNRYSFRETLGWKSGGMVWWHYVAILVGFFAISAVVASYFPEQDNELTRILRSSRVAVYFVAFLATFTAPLVEEVIYRGVLYSAFQRTIGPIGAVVLVTLMFAIVHFPQYYPSYSTMFLLLLLSLILTLVRTKTGNLLPCIILHTIFNAAMSLSLILEPYFKAGAPVIEPTTGFILK